jgi:hypothetical protein
VSAESPSLVEARPARLGVQPLLGLAGLALVVPIAALMALGVGGPEGSAVVLGPPAVFSLALVATVAFWWEDWPGTTLQPRWSGWADTLRIAVLAVGLTLLAQAFVGHLDLRGVFLPDPGPGHSPVFPATLPLGGAAFVTLLQLTLVCEGWPFRRLGAFAGGVAALAASWAIALVIYLTLVDVHPPAGSGLVERSGPLAGANAGALLILIGLWQTVFFIAWRGWPFSTLSRRAVRLAAGNVAVIGAALATEALAAAGGLEPVETIALAGSLIAAALIFAMLFDGWVPGRPSVARQRALVLCLSLAGATLLYGGLDAYARSRPWTTVEPLQWVAHVVLNAISLSVILHVGIGRRWPFAEVATPSAGR